MRSLVLLLALMALGGCMNVSDMGEGVRYHMSDAGLLDHSDTRRSLSIRLQPDSFIFIGQGAFMPPGKGPLPRQNVVAEQAFKSFVEYFPLVRRAQGPLGLEDAIAQARSVGPTMSCTPVSHVPMIVSAMATSGMTSRPSTALDGTLAWCR
ncbi:hypothetical protein PspTeo4_02328 [Pseudomonas sp. Teo4]|nr:hypothetical protein [Pseudomonas sp. Teo4]